VTVTVHPRTRRADLDNDDSDESPALLQVLAPRPETRPVSGPRWAQTSSRKSYNRPPSLPDSLDG
jgi:hypothetical protein